MMRQALWAAREMNLSRLTLAVDSNNAPALRLYYRHGMQRIGSKVALMRDLAENTKCRMPNAGSGMKLHSCCERRLRLSTVRLQAHCEAASSDRTPAPAHSQVHSTLSPQVR